MIDVRLALRMINDERTARDRFARRLRQQPLEKSVESGEVLGPLRVVEGPGRSDFMEVRTYYSRFRKGDKVDLLKYDGCTQSSETLVPAGELEIKALTYPHDGVIRFEVTRKRQNRPETGKDYFFYPQGSGHLDYRLLTVIEQQAGITRPRPSGLLKRLRQVSCALETLNESQRDAFLYLVDCAQDGCTQGPPGTGKTELLRALVHASVESNFSVGLAAFTHAAVDNAFSRLVSLQSSDGFLRIGQAIKIRDELYPNGWISAHHVRSFSAASSQPHLVAATTHSWILSPNAPVVDVLIIDEAAQVPAFMQSALHAKARHVILLGDHRQLPPVLQADHPGMPARDVFSLQLDDTTPMLSTQYRMNRDIQGWSAQRYYGGRLHPHVDNADRDILARAAVLHAELGCHPVQLLTHGHKGQRQANRGEADLVAGKVLAILEKGQVLSSQLGVISPHRMQNGAICRALQRRLGFERATDILVDTVERFQGQEREVIILSFGCDADHGASNGPSQAFIGDPRRINVSITRARSRFYCVASEALMQSAKRSGRADSKTELADFLNWCQQPALVA